MRILLTVSLLPMLALSGCASKKSAEPQFPTPPPTAATAAPSPAAGTNQALIVTPENALVGKVARVDRNARFVVLNFPIGQMVAVEQRLNLYRRGLKVGEVKVTGPQREDNIVADLVAGEAEVGDEARSQ